MKKAYLILAIAAGVLCLPALTHASNSLSPNTGLNSQNLGSATLSGTYIECGGWEVYDPNGNIVNDFTLTSGCPPWSPTDSNQSMTLGTFPLAVQAIINTAESGTFTILTSHAWDATACVMPTSTLAGCEAAISGVTGWSASTFDFTYTGGYVPSDIIVYTPANSSTDPNFRDWVVGTTDTSSLANIPQGAWLAIQYWEGTSTTPTGTWYTDQAQLNQPPPHLNIAEFSNEQIVSPDLTTSTDIYTMFISKKKVADFAQFGSTSTWQLWLYYYTSTTAPTILSEQSFNFYVNQTPPRMCFGTYCEQDPNFVPPGSVNQITTQAGGTPIAIDCADISTSYSSVVQDIYFAGCTLAMKLFNPDAAPQDFMSSTLNGFTGVLPFSIFFDLKDDLINAATAANSSTDDYELAFDLPSVDGNPAHSVHIPILESSSLEQAVGSTTKNMVFTLEDNFMWLALGAVMIKIIL